MAKEIIATEVVALGHLKFCADADWTESLTDLGFIDDMTPYEMLADEHLRQYISKKAEESKEVVTNDVLDRLVADKLHIDMTDDRY